MPQCTCTKALWWYMLCFKLDFLLISSQKKDNNEVDSVKCMHGDGTKEVQDTSFNHPEQQVPKLY